MNSSNKLEVKNINFSFNDEKILEDINFSIKSNEVISILGPSGVGKSTLFNIIAGLLKTEHGKIVLDGEEITNSSGKISYMLQKDLLLPYRNVYENISLPLEIKEIDKKQIKEKISSVVGDFGLENLLNKYPKELSGGQKQRVALLRTYMMSSNLLLLDEPFSSLDYFTKHSLYNWFLNLKNNLKLSFLIITHDIDEAIFLSDRIFLLNGRPAKLTQIYTKGEDTNNLKNMIKQVSSV